MAEFTNEFELARNFGFDITMPDGNMGLTSAAHMEYMHKCTALYKNFMYNMNNIIRFEKDTKKQMSKLHKEKMENMRFSLYQSVNAASGNDPFARKNDNLSASFGGLDSRMNTPWGLGEVPDEGEEEEQATRPQTAPAFTNTKKQGPSGDLPTDGRESVNKQNEETASMAGLSDLGTAKDKVMVGVIDPKTEKRIVVGNHSFAKLGHKSVKVKLKNRDGMFTMRPLRPNSENNSRTVPAFQPVTNIGFDPVNEKLAMVKQQTSYLTPTIASDMKINNRIPIQKSLKGIDTKRTTVVEIYRNARDRTSRHIRIVTKKPKGDSGGAEARSSRMSFVKTKVQSVYALQGPLKNTPRLIAPMTPDIDVNEAIPSPTPRTPSRVAFAGDDQTGDFPATLDMRGRSDTVSSTGNRLKPPEGAPIKTRRLSFCDVASAMMGRRASISLEQSDLSALSALHRTDSQDTGILGRSLNMPDGETTQSAAVRKASIVSACSAAIFINKLKNAAGIGVPPPGFKEPKKIVSRTDAQKMIKQQKVKDTQLDDNMNSWRRRMAMRPSVSSKTKGRVGDRRLKLI